jgi:transcriptional regulator with XRE-family HTH domain
MLGRFLREQRAQVTLEQAGLGPRRGSRRGTLTQEDLARLTGYAVRTISALEQGTEHRPTPELLEALAMALALGPEERHTLWYLATGAPPPALAAAGAQDVHPGLLRLLAVLDGQFAYLTDGVRSVVAQTSLCRAWAGDLTRQNLSHWIFFNSHARHVYPYWDREPAASIIANLRSQFARSPADAELRAVVDELRELSPDARRLWDTQAVVQYHPPAYVTMRLPGHTDPEQSGDERYRITMNVVHLTPTTPGDEHRITVFMPPEGTEVVPPGAEVECAACERHTAGELPSSLVQEVAQVRVEVGGALQVGQVADAFHDDQPRIVQAAG